MWPFSRKPNPEPTKGVDPTQPILACHLCSEKATFHLTWVENRRCVGEKHLCENHARAALASDFATSGGHSRAPSISEHCRKFDIELIFISEVYEHQLVYLHEMEGDRRVPILIGLFEAAALDRKARGYQSPRPLTHDAMVMIIQSLGAEVQDVVVDRLDEVPEDRLKEYFNHAKVWHATVRMRRGADLVAIDIRPSDAFMLAMAVNCPIYFTEEVLERAG